MICNYMFAVVELSSAHASRKWSPWLVSADKQISKYDLFNNEIHLSISSITVKIGLIFQTLGRIKIWAIFSFGTLIKLNLF